jgi:hypothetical protein
LALFIVVLWYAETSAQKQVNKERSKKGLDLI